MAVCMLVRRYGVSLMVRYVYSGLTRMVWLCDMRSSGNCMSGMPAPTAALLPS